MADNAIQDPKESSAEMQEILKDLEGQGHTIAGKEPAPAATEPVKPPQEEKKPTDPVKPENKKEGDGEEGKKSDKQIVDRTPKSVPVHVHNEERHKRQDAEKRAEEAEKLAAELRAQIAGNANKPTTEGSDDIKATATQIAEEFGLKPEFVEKFTSTIVKIAEKRNVLPQEITAQLASLKQAEAKAQEVAHAAEQETGFTNEFSDVLKDFPDLADHKEALKELAFTEGNEKIPLRLLALGYLHDNKPGRTTAEAPVQTKEKAGVDDVLDFENMTEDQLKGLSGEKFDLYMTWMEKQGRKR